MSQQTGSFAQAIDVIDELAASLATLGESWDFVRPRIGQMAMYLSALRHQLARDPRSPRVIVLLGGTGTGKSTLLNRLLHADVSQASFRRTFTAGAVAAMATIDALPEGFADLPAEDATTVPTRGVAERLTRVVLAGSCLPQVVLVDSPDLDGSIPQHHGTAERLFRFADVVLFVTSPEKYQMTEMWPFYGLAARYGVPSLFVMNKLDEPGPGEDFERKLQDKLGTHPSLFLVPRDDSTYAVDHARSLDALRETLAAPPSVEEAVRTAGQRRLAEDLAGRIGDWLICPAETRRRNVEEALDRLKSVQASHQRFDVSDVVAKLRRRLEEKSILYLLGPRRVWDRVRRLPGVVARLPRSVVDALSRRQVEGKTVPDQEEASSPPKIPETLVEELIKHQVPLEELLGPFGDSSQEWKINPSEAARVGQEELDRLKKWMAERWDREPRDTRLVRKLLGVLPGGDRLVHLAEAAPYLLTAACVVKGTVLGPIDLVILGVYGGVTWAIERLSNEVRAMVADINVRIEQRFAALVDLQDRRAREWLDTRAPTTAEIDVIRSRVDQLLAAVTGGARGA